MCTHPTQKRSVESHPRSCHCFCRGGQRSGFQFPWRTCCSIQFLSQAAAGRSLESPCAWLPVGFPLAVSSLSMPARRLRFARCYDWEFKLHTVWAAAWMAHLLDQFPSLPADSVCVSFFFFLFGCCGFFLSWRSLCAWHQMQTEVPCSRCLFTRDSSCFLVLGELASLFCP